MLARRGQTILEYTIIVGIVAVMLSIMGTGLKRGVQSLVKITADQVGNQQNSDQDFNDTMQGYMVGTNVMVQDSGFKQIAEGTVFSGTTNASFNESTITMTNTITNGGFSIGGQ